MEIPWLLTLHFWGGPYFAAGQGMQGYRVMIESPVWRKTRHNQYDHVVMRKDLPKSLTIASNI